MKKISFLLAATAQSSLSSKESAPSAAQGSGVSVSSTVPVPVEPFHPPTRM